MKIAVDMGHTLKGIDYGAVGIRPESILTREVGNMVIEKLKSLGHTVINCTKDTCNSLSESLSYRVNTANNSNADLFISIHFNCYNRIAHGTEVLTYGGKEFTEATRVLNNIVALGYENRKIKDGSKLYVLRNTKMKSMLVECCFCDNKEDMNRFNAENMANAIVNGITGQTITQKPTQSINTNSFITIDGGGYATYNDGKSGINLIIRDFSDDIMRAFAYVDNDKNASWSFDLVPPNDNYEKLSKGCNKVVTVRNGGYTFCKGSIYKIRIDGYNKEYKKVCSTTIALKIPN